MNRKYLITAVVYAVFIFFISTQPVPEETSEWFPYQDKVVHIVLYMIFSILMAMGMLQSKNPFSIPKVAGISILVSFLYGLFIEICQIFVPTRSFDIIDALANLMGSLIGVILAICFSFIINQLFLRTKIPIS